jgi:hypothetical protein
MLFNNRKTTNVNPRINTPVITPRSENLPSEAEDVFRNLGIGIDTSPSYKEGKVYGEATTCEVTSPCLQRPVVPISFRAFSTTVKGDHNVRTQSS